MSKTINIMENTKLIFGISFTVILCLSYLAIASYMNSPEGLQYPNPGHYPGEIGPGTFNCSSTDLALGKCFWKFVDIIVTGTADISKWAHSNKVTNLNADKIDGYDASDLLAGGGSSLCYDLWKDGDGDGFPRFTTQGTCEDVKPFDCDDTDPNLFGAPDGSCDGDGDGFIDYLALHLTDYWCDSPVTGFDPDDTDPTIIGYNIDGDGILDISYYQLCEIDGDLKGIDLDPWKADSSASSSGTILFRVGPHNGNLGGRAGADALCESEKPSKLQCNNIHAFISVSDSDEIRDMPSKYGYALDKPVYYYQASGKLVLIAYGWEDMLNGNIRTTVEPGIWWSGSNEYGQIDANCNGWTSSSSEDYGQYGCFAYSDIKWIAYGSIGYRCDAAGTSIYITCACTP